MSWLRDQRSTRKYLINDNKLWLVDNQYQKFKCGHCEDSIYGRLTIITFFNSADLKNHKGQELHINHRTDLDELKSVLIKYIDDIGVYEKNIDGVWSLVWKDNVIGKEIDE